jgi:mannobiose 2-epimerase
MPLTPNGRVLRKPRENWTVSKPGFEGGDRKSLDAHMHLMESFTTLYEASGTDVHRRKLLEIVG